MACKPNIQFNKRFSPDDVAWFERERVAGEPPFPSAAEFFALMRAAYENASSTYAKVLYNRQVADKPQAEPKQTETPDGASVPIDEP